MSTEVMVAILSFFGTVVGTFVICRVKFVFLSPRLAVRSASAFSLILPQSTQSV